MTLWFRERLSVAPSKSGLALGFPECTAEARQTPAADMETGGEERKRLQGPPLSSGWWARPAWPRSCATPGRWPCGHCASRPGAPQPNCSYSLGKHLPRPPAVRTCRRERSSGSGAVGVCDQRKTRRLGQVQGIPPGPHSRGAGGFQPRRCCLPRPCAGAPATRPVFGCARHNFAQNPLPGSRR